MLCARCQEEIDTGLTFSDDPPRAFYQGEPLHIPAGQLVILRRLAETGRAQFRQLHANHDSLRVQIHNLRARLPEGLAIVAVPGWGYQLQVSPMP